MAVRRDVIGSDVIPVALILLFALSGTLACTGNTCADCIASGAECAWCTDANFTSIPGDRCGLQGILKSQGCINITNPSTREDNDKRRADALTDGSYEEDKEAVQLHPQEMYVKLRPRGKGHDFLVRFRPANNFPVDLYFLFDLSFTMKTYIADFAKLAKEIASEIEKISTNYRMGYGTFQDKVLLPFTNTHPAKLKNPCPNNENCAPPFDFRHELSMTRNIDNFITAVQWSTGNTTGNIDRPEGGFDAIMQAIVCKAVGWRENSRQLIIFASDARMHFAGDGKLAGLIIPNDAQCHLDNGHTNSMSKIQDYPSVGQLSEALDQSKKYVIFAVVEDVVREYTHLTSRMSRSFVNTLKGGEDSNVVSIVRDKYREMTEGVKLEYKSSSPNIQVSITPTCEFREGSSCTNLKIGKEVEPFKVNVRAERCPEDPRDRIQHVVIAPTDFLRDSLNLTVEIICDCDCQLEPDQKMEPAEECSHGNGTMECGICHCFEGRSGRQCECGQQEQGLADVQGSCSPEGRNSSSQGPECSGLGECVCGVCRCLAGYSGRYCQCNEKACPIFDGLVCAGNGECRCEECRCSENFTGRACECPKSTDTCMADEVMEEEGGEQKLCSGHGRCHCGRCSCDEGYLGSHCQTCFLCGDSVCEDDTYNYRQCAMCAINSQTQCPDDCPVIVMQEVVLDETRAAKREVCRDYLTEDCHVRFAVHNPGTSNTTLHVQRAQVCTQGPDILLIVLGVVGGVVGVGLILLLLVKLLTTLFDRLEYQHFLRELQSPKWAKHNNPIYKEATTTYYNPVMTRD
ncbi:integrin beta-3-like [Babylonia areolata]|uniref:integrin beta-3-like n=1 Tax=Babylonia areolata TaxID=304850 RepID=UPI003FD02A0E